MKEFRAFLLRGNVVDLAVGVVIGAAFGAVVDSLVKNVIMPPIGKLTGGVDFSKLAISLGGDDKISYGLFINAVITFFLIAAAVFFFVVKPMARLMPAPKTESAPATRECTECLTSIPLKAKRCSACGQPQPVKRSA